MKEIFDLDGIDVLAAGDDDVLLAVYQEVEAVLVLHRHIAGIQPSVLIQDFSCRFRIVVVADHDAGALHCQLSDFTLLNFLTVLIDDLALPLVSGDTDRADLVHVLNAEVHAAGSERLGQAVVGVVIMIREVILPVADERRRNRLRADVHETPLAQSVIFHLEGSAVERLEDILRPRDKEPYDGAVLVGDGL